MSVPRPFRGGRNADQAQRGALSRGEAARVPCRLRRTSARGWGLWSPATLVLGPLPDGEARWLCPDPVAVGFPATKGSIDLPFTEVSEIWLRPVRFQTEAFHGMEAEIVVVASPNSTIEVATATDVAALVADRLHDLLLGRRPDAR
ncbi:MAG: hypothetical protein ACR2MB_13920 [Acidimicrobiales bacterium]